MQWYVKTKEKYHINHGIYYNFFKSKVKTKAFKLCSNWKIFNFVTNPLPHLFTQSALDLYVLEVIILFDWPFRTEGFRNIRQNICHPCKISSKSGSSWWFGCKNIIHWRSRFLNCKVKSFMTIKSVLEPATIVQPLLDIGYSITTERSTSGSWEDVLHYTLLFMYITAVYCVFYIITMYNSPHFTSPLHTILYCIRIRTRGGVYGQIYPFAWRSSREKSPRELLKAKRYIWP